MYTLTKLLFIGPLSRLEQTSFPPTGKCLLLPDTGL